MRLLLYRIQSRLTVENLCIGTDLRVLKSLYIPSFVAYILLLPSYSPEDILYVYL